MTADAYEELPYRVRYPVEAHTSIQTFAAEHGLRRSPVEFTLNTGIKAQALLAYASQLRWIQPLLALAPERLWRLDPSGSGDHGVSEAS